MIEADSSWACSGAIRCGARDSEAEYGEVPVKDLSARPRSGRLTTPLAEGPG
jgi:hypothetical protein